MGDRPSVPLADRMRGFGLPIGRLKTGTPPRLDGRTIDWAKLEMQPGDDEPTLFSFLHDKPFVRQISCGITHTNDATHAIIRDNLSRSAMYGGHIEGVGPRYCPSIEDKVVRFADKSSHQIFLEPEGLDDPTIYPNGISTSLPAEVQEAYVHSIAGLERAVITQPGYAIEYDYVDPRALSTTLELKDVPGLNLLGYQDRQAVRVAMARAAVVVVPSICYEGLPTVIPEAFAAGTPVVASGIGAMPELVAEGVTGFLAAPGDPVSLVGALARIELPLKPA